MNPAISADTLVPTYSRTWLEEAIELSAGRVEGALLIFGRTVSYEWSAFLIQGCKHNRVDRLYGAKTCHAATR